jgi:DNA-binding response OmpR family regulator
LIVDDSEVVREGLRKVLRTEGHEVLTASDGEDALRNFDPATLDLLLLDLKMPNKDGWDTLNEMFDRNPVLKIIVITGQPVEGTPDKVEMAAVAGARALLQKPLNIERLLETVAALLAEPTSTHLQRLCTHRTSFRFVPPSRFLPGACEHGRFVVGWDLSPSYRRGGLNE